jgi:hypothetical protein
MSERLTGASSSRLAHGWRLRNEAQAPGELVREFIQPAVRAVPSSMARRLGSCRIVLVSEADSTVTSRWAETDLGLEVVVTTSGLEGHDIAMELLLCLGQALWGRLSSDELRAYWTLLEQETSDGITGEIDEQALEEKRACTGRRQSLERHGFASFAGTAAEYVHCLWHDVTIRIGPDHLPAPQLRRRLDLLARWFPPDRGHRLFPFGRSTGHRPNV